MDIVAGLIVAVGTIITLCVMKLYDYYEKRHQIHKRIYRR
jgi:hypothetical protein